MPWPSDVDWPFIAGRDADALTAEGQGIHITRGRHASALCVGRLGTKSTVGKGANAANAEHDGILRR